MQHYDVDLTICLKMQPGGPFQIQSVRDAIDS
jgi:hypothetical protein